MRDLLVVYKYIYTFFAHLVPQQSLKMDIERIAIIGAGACGIGVAKQVQMRPYRNFLGSRD
jgi:hypothetical protein